MVVHGAVDERVADLGVTVVAVTAAAMCSPPAAVRDPPELLDVDVDQVARSISFVATDHASRGSVHPHQPVEVAAHQDPVNVEGAMSRR